MKSTTLVGRILIVMASVAIVLWLIGAVIGVHFLLKYW